MSSIIRSFIVRDLVDPNIVNECLLKLGFSQVLSTMPITLSNGITLTPLEGSIRISYVTNETMNYTMDTTAGQFIKKLTETYQIIQSERLERLRYEEAVLTEKLALRKIAQEEHRMEQMRITQERDQIERERQEQAAQLQKQIQEKISQVTEKANTLGYKVRVEQRGTERIMVLIRSA
jgi:hypothetical protein